MGLYAKKPRNYEEGYKNIKPTPTQKGDTMTKKQRMYAEIDKHGANLNAIFNTELDNVKLCKKLHSFEIKAHHATTCLCNTNTLDRLELTRQEARTDIKQATEEKRDAFFEKILDNVDKVLNFKKQGVPVFVNYDPRGYALKINNGYVRENNLRICRDWGGYGILAPEFDGKV